MKIGQRKCQECGEIPLFGEYRGQACCNVMSQILKSRATGEPLQAYMDKETTRDMCKNQGEGCPILEIAKT